VRPASEIRACTKAQASHFCCNPMSSASDLACKGDFCLSVKIPEFQNVGWRPQHSGNTGMASLCYQFPVLISESVLTTVACFMF